MASSTEGFAPQEGDLVIAADAGFDRMTGIGATPDLCVGDFDSVQKILEGIPMIRHPVRKDDTDLLLAVKIGFERGYESFVIFGSLGGRLDQTLASVQTAVYIAERGGTAVFFGEGECLTAIKNGTVKFKAKHGGYISVFSHNEKALGVTEKGLSFEIENAELTNSFPLGVSNEFINHPALISVKEGTLVIIWQGSINDIISEN